MIDTEKLKQIGGLKSDLRGIETCLYVQSIKFIKKLKSDLRGIETVKPLSCSSIELG